MMFKSVLRYDEDFKCLRLFRLLGQYGEFGKGGYSWKFSVSLRPVLFSYDYNYLSYAFTLLGLRLHYKRSYGGIIQ